MSCNLFNGVVAARSTAITHCRATESNSSAPTIASKLAFFTSAVANHAACLTHVSQFRPERQPDLPLVIIQPAHVIESRNFLDFHERLPPKIWRLKDCTKGMFIKSSLGRRNLVKLSNFPWVKRLCRAPLTVSSSHELLYNLTTNFSRLFISGDSRENSSG